MQKRGDMGNPLQFIPLERYEKNLSSFHPKDQEKITKAIKERLPFNPIRYPMLQGGIPISGVNLTGLRHLKTGVMNAKGGAYVLYRYCKECLANKYYEKNKVRCQFCDENMKDRIVLFDVQIRSTDYK